MSAPDPRTVVVVMGVAGSGKTTVARLLAQRLGWIFAEADDFHSAANVAKMSAGTPLTDEDRGPWLEAVRAWLDGCPGDAVITCSALRRRYRDVLRGAHSRVRFLHLAGSPETLRGRLAARAGHFMPVSLLESQLATLEPLEPDEDGVVVDVVADPPALVQQAIAALELTPAGSGR
jgi:gluconokinase